MLTQRHKPLATPLFSSVAVLLAASVAIMQGAAPAKTAAPASAPVTKPVQPDETAPVTPVDTTLVPSTKGKKASELWDDLVHYIKIARPDIAKTFGEAVLDSGATPRDIYILSITTPDSQAVLGRGTASKELKDVISRLRKMIEEGYASERGDPKQIDRAIKMLTESERAYALGVERLKKSGEWALPQLLMALSDSKSSVDLRNRIVSVLPQLGKDAVRGLSCALQTRNAEAQEVIAGALGQLGYPHAAPYLKELLERKDVLDQTRKTAQSALLSCAEPLGPDAAKRSAAELFYDLAEKYYSHAGSVRPDERFETANIWYWQEGLGLTFKPVPLAQFYDIYAMRSARQALQCDPKLSKAISLWLAAYINREVSQGAAGTATQAAAELLPAKFYVLASSAKYEQDVLAMAIRDKNAAMAVKVIEALVQTAGAKSLVEPVSGGTAPLVDALSFPDRQARYLAAEALVKALPDKEFKGAQFVMPVLVEALRQTGKKTAVLVCADSTQGAALKDAIRAVGYEVIDNARGSEAIRLAREAAGVDVFVVGSQPDAAGVVGILRPDATFSGTPVLIAGQSAKCRDLATKDGRIVLADAKIDANGMGPALSEAVNLGAGKPFTPEQAVEWTVRAAEAVRLLGLTGTKAYDIGLAKKALIADLGHADPKAQVAAARALAVMSDASAQQAIASLAMRSDADEKVRVEAFDAATESVRRFGNLLSSAQAKSVIEAVMTKGSEPIRVAAAKLLGSLNLPSEQINELIVGAPIE